MTASSLKSNGQHSLTYAGYTTNPYDPEYGTPDPRLTQTGRGTPGGEYLRRFWHVVAREQDFGKLPKRIRIMGENLVIFKDRRGEIGLLHLHCCHRGASLEYGIIEERGIRCCYHGRLFDTDGTMLEVPGEPGAEQMKSNVCQGAYPTYVFAGLVFAYMGPPEKKPPFPRYDSFEVPGIRLEPGSALPFACSWTQIKDNALDPAHTAVLHAIEGPDQFSPSFGVFPEMAFSRSTLGLLNVCARRVDDLVWARSTDIIMPNIHCLTSIIEDGTSEKPYSPPWLSIWTTPVDDENSINFLLSHIHEDDDIPAERRRYLEDFGQSAERPYEDRQAIPGDYDAMVSQGGVAIHDHEHLGRNDVGVVLFRSLLAEGIDMVERGEDPPYINWKDGEVQTTFVNNQARRVPEGKTPPKDRAILLQTCKTVIEESWKTPPQTLRGAPAVIGAAGAPAPGRQPRTNPA
jgi:nitrite reductase/ring-hydroxylating ferredoxin subunit